MTLTVTFNTHLLSFTELVVCTFKFSGHTSFVEIDLLVPVKKIFEGFLPYMGMASILGHMTASYQQIFISMYLKAYTQNLVKNDLVISEKSMF